VESGRSVRNRPGLQRALDACRSGEADGIVAAKVDRLSRSIVDFAGLLEEGRARGFNVVALDLGVDLSTPQGELIAHVVAAVAQWERRMIGQRTRQALAIKRAGSTRGVSRPRMVGGAGTRGPFVGCCYAKRDPERSSRRNAIGGSADPGCREQQSLPGTTVARNVRAPVRPP